MTTLNAGFTIVQAWIVMISRMRVLVSVKVLVVSILLQILSGGHLVADAVGAPLQQLGQVTLKMCSRTLNRSSQWEVIRKGVLRQLHHLVHHHLKELQVQGRLIQQEKQRAKTFM